MNEFDKTSEMDVSSVNKRRSFLKKSATGVVIASLPAKSVWGACSVSGALSGNLSTNTDRHDCTINLDGGRSPGNWMNYRQNIHDTFDVVAQAKRDYGNKSQTYKDIKNLYRNAVKSVCSNVMVLPSELNPLSMTVEQGLGSNGYHGNLYFHLAAVYLNAYFGFYTAYASGRGAAEQAITDVFLFWKQSGESISQNDLGYTEGTTSYTL